MGVHFAAPAQAQNICPLPSTQPPLCELLAQDSCINPPAGTECYPFKVRFSTSIPGLLEAVDCSCATLGEFCGPIYVNGDELRCPGQCDPPVPGEECQVLADGVPTGQTFVNFTTYPDGTEFECGCMSSVPVGACCLDDGSCAVVPATQCAGTYAGDGTTCLGNVACCLPDGSCTIIDEACCTNMGGSISPVGACLGDANGNMIDDGCEPPPMCEPTTDGLACRPSNCPIAGQECLPRCILRHSDGTIEVEICECISPNECHLEYDPTSGFQCVGSCPPGQMCQTTNTSLPNGDRRICCECVDIPPVDGACCLPDGTCVVGPATDCQGTYLGDGTACGGTGACCYDADGDGVAETCQVVNQICCERVYNGSYRGDGTLCGASLACCLPGGTCIVMDEFCCLDQGGTPVGGMCQGDNNGNMIDDACEPEVGACCLPDGTCVIVPQTQCQGTFLGNGTACGGSGACCFDSDGDGIPDGCSVVDKICCEASLGGTFQGAGSVCAGKGACCYDPAGAPAGQCVVIDKVCCDDIGGTFYGVGTICLGDSNNDGSDDLCVPVGCDPAPDHLSCLPHDCPDPGDECLPRCVLQLDDGTYQIINCECRSPDECHLEWTPGTQPTCIGGCPPGFHCETTYTTTPVGQQICCDCVEDAPECVPTPDRTACEPHICDDPNEECVPRCVRVGPNGQVEVLDCDCRAPDECRVSDFAPGDLPVCTGNCPPGQHCVSNLVIDADGTIQLCCDCVPNACDCPGDMNGDGVRNGLDIAGFVRCFLGNPNANDNCDCADVNQDGFVDINDVSELVAIILSKEPCPKVENCPPEDLILDISTGVDDGGNIIPVNMQDDTWTVISEPPPTGTLPRPAVVIPPNSAWNTIPGTQWISANQTGPNGTYIYEFCFCLNNRFSNPALDMAIRADDEFDVYLNGALLASLPGGFNNPNPAMLSFNNPALFHPGENCIQIVVRNVGGVVTGFNMQGSVRATDGKCCCDLEDLSEDLASGVDGSGNLIASGADDDTWTVTVDPSGGAVPRPATVINPNSAWLTIPGTKWIAASYTGPNGAYTYEHCFCLNKWFEDAQVILDLRADDRAEVYLNGSLVGMTPPTYAFNTPMPTHVVVNNQSLFRVGENCIEVIVYNTHGVVTGVNMAGRVTARNGLCCDDQVECGPTDDGQGCKQAICPERGESCVPVCINISANGVATVSDCDCRGPTECHAVFDGTLPPVCEGDCPDGYVCNQRIVQRADGSVDYCCECVETPILGACCFSALPCMQLSQADCEAQGGVYLGDFTSCIGDQACCLQNGTCIDTDAICCEFIYGGIPQGPGSVCLGDNNGDGRDDLCYPPDCGPVPHTTRCRPVICPTTGEKCKPRCVRVEAGTTFVIEVLDCECMGPNDCHVEIDPLTNNYYCSGHCPVLGSYCHTTVTDLGDGTQKVCCECADVPPPYSCCNDETGACLDLAPGVMQCPVGYSLVAGPCGNPQACCLPTGNCVDTYLACCNAMGGMPQGPGTNCATTQCPQPICRAIPGALRCSSTICPNPGEECLPRCVQVEPGTNIVLDIIDCDCVSPNECHIEIDPVTRTYFCVGACPIQGQTCTTTTTTLPDGTLQVCCECTDQGPPMSCCNPDTGECVDLAPGSTDCPPGFTLVPGPCGELQACCLPDGTCLDTFIACCDDLGGSPQGSGTNCQNTECPQPECLPIPGTPFCSSTVCPNPGEECLPRCVRVDAGSTQVLEVVDCNCVSPNDCHIEVDAANNYTCVGGCPAGSTCRTTITDNSDGTQTVCCECVPDVAGICDIAQLQGADRCAPFQQSQCTSTDPSAFCAPALVFGDPAVGVIVEQCSCFHDGDCGPIEIIGDTQIQCAGECITGVPCVVQAGGVPQPPGPVDVLQFPVGTDFRCVCP